MSSHPVIANIRKVYQKNHLTENEVDKNPIVQFEKWWNEAIEAEVEEVNAMTLATCTRDGKPSARIVLLKGIHDSGFVFFTNYTSRKGRELDVNPNVALVFFWKELERQVRIEGRVERVSDEESTTYFISRPEASKIGAWASPQSQVIPSVDFLQEKQLITEQEFEGKDIPRPAFWGGYIVHPSSIEFWQGRPGRLHDRLRYTLTGKTTWKLERLAP